MSWQPAKLCVSLLPKSYSDLPCLFSGHHQADFLELRLDYFKQFDFLALDPAFIRKMIVTIRSEKEGGYWKGNVADCARLYQSAIHAGVPFIDIEWTFASTVLRRLKLKPGTRVILSCHTTERDFLNLKGLLECMRETPAEVYKLVFTALELNDNLTAVRLMDVARKLQIKFIVHAMGEAGKISRILGALKGNYMVYVSADRGFPTAPGQLSLKEARQYYHLPRGKPHVRLLGLLGYPTRHSKGWRLHNELVQRKKSQVKISGENKSYDYIYLNFPTPDLQRFWKEWNRFISGLSVTIPYKEDIVQYIDESSLEVRQSGVCNTVVRQRRRWVGFNTDLLAIEDLLRPYRQILKDGVLIVGTGATARSAVVALQRLEVYYIFVTGRNTRRGKLFTRLFGVRFVPLSQIKWLEVSGIIQTTPVGMFPDIHETPAGTELFKKHMVVLDVVYNPPVTCFLKKARQCECITISGEEMFFRQAMRQFAIFTGWHTTLKEVRSIWNSIVNSSEED